MPGKGGGTRPAPSAGRKLRLRTIALPPEHGSWGLVLEPIALGMLVAPSAAGLALGLGAFAAFLVRRPLKLAWTLRNRRTDPRRGPALGFAAVFGATAAASFACATARAGLPPLLPLLAVSPLAVVFLAQDLEHRSRSVTAETIGPVVFAAVAPAMAMAAGWKSGPAFALAAVLAGRAIPSVLYVRARLRKDRGLDPPAWPILAVHLAALAAIAVPVHRGWLPRVALLPFAVLFLRAALGLSRWRIQQSTRAIGFTEMGLGIFTVLWVAAGYSW